MQNFFKTKLFKILFVLTASLFGMIIFKISTGNEIFIKNIVTTAAASCTKAAVGIHYGVLDFFNSFFKGGTYKEENELLKKELAELRKTTVLYNTTKSENEQLKQALNIRNSNKNFEVEIASFVARNPNDFTGFTIDAGKNKNITSGDVVLTKNGLVGTITNSYSDYSNVSTILGTDVQIPAVDSQSEADDKGVVCGNLDFSEEGLTIMNHLSKSNKCKVGDIISTFGNSNYPENILIGRIKEIRNNKNGMSCFAIIEPFENVMCVKDVVVIKRAK